MGNLYKINSEILRLQDACEWDDDRKAYIDTDTGEIMTDEEYKAMFDSLQMDKREIHEWMVKYILNAAGDIASIKAEIDRLTKKVKAAEKSKERMLEILSQEYPDGEKFGIADLKCRTSEATTFDESAPSVARIVEWLQDHDLDEAVTYQAPKLNKTELKRLIKGGTEIPGVTVEKKKNYRIS